MLNMRFCCIDHKALLGDIDLNNSCYQMTKLSKNVSLKSLSELSILWSWNFTHNSTLHNVASLINIGN